jgi:calcineurin-like phosphoesterase family protein
MKKFYIADWHYDHKNIIALDNRPFKSVIEMNTTLIETWNNTVSNEDDVYIPGDMFWCEPKIAMEVLDKLNGKKVLIRGNHDRRHPELDKKFIQVVDYLEIKDKDRHVVLSHYPIPCFKNHYYGWYHLYGHVHNSFEYNMMEHDKYLMEELYGKQCKMYNVGAMMPYMDYTPRTLDEIINNVR